MALRWLFSILENEDENHCLPSFIKKKIDFNNNK